MRLENKPFSLETVEFLLRRPWFFVFPFVIIGTITLTWIFSTAPIYESTAVLSLGGGGTAITGKSAQERKDYLISKVLLGENMRDIIKEVWPGFKEETYPARYNRLVDTLRNPRTGINMVFDRKDPSLLNISFISTSPDVAYKIVQATIATIRIENRKAIEDAIETSLFFLRKQLIFYKNKLTAIDQEMVRIKDELKELSVGLSPAEADLVREVTSAATFGGTGEFAAQKAVKFEEILADLNLQLVDATKKKEFLEEHINNKDFSYQLMESQNISGEVFNKAIAEKELAVSDLIARGYLPDHPVLKRLKKSLDDLKAIGSARIEDVTGGALEMTESEKKSAEEAMKADLKDVEFTIEALKAKIATIENYRQTAEEKLRQSGTGLSPVAIKVAQLKELKSEKEITEKYYNDIRKQLEETDLKNRVEKSDAGFVINVVEEPKIPINPLPSKKTAGLLLGMVMAIGAGVVCSYTADSLDKSIKSAAELRELFRIPVLGAVDKIYTVQELEAERLRGKTIGISLAVSVLVTAITVKLLMVLRVIT